MSRLLRYSLLITTFLLLFLGCSAPKGIYHTVQRGQTLYRIGHVYQVDIDHLARVNRLHDRSRLEVGQRLFIPGASSIRSVPSTAIAGTKPAAKKPAPSVKKAPTRIDRPVKTANQDKPAVSRSPSSAQRSTDLAASRGVFVWPVKGSIVKNFGQNGAQANKGIEIAVQAGRAVVASAAGKVTYSGDGIKGFGHLIILKHDNSYFTVYGFNQENLVKSGSFVSQGQDIALAGRPPSGGPSRLHFEIRRGKEAVNPVQLLP